MRGYLGLSGRFLGVFEKGCVVPVRAPPPNYAPPNYAPPNYTPPHCPGAN